MTANIVSILVVDDDQVFSRFVGQLVQAVTDELPCEVQGVATAEAALALIRSGAFELALVDYNLPAGSGLDLLANIRELPAQRQPAVIMLTGSGNEAVAVEAMKRGAKDYLKKDTLDVPSLMRAMQNALAQKHLADKVAAYDAQVRADLEMARRLQNSLLPLQYPSFPRSASPADSALRFEHRYFWTAQLGGDFFSVQSLSDTEAGVLICDVMGHGVRSALVTAMLRAMVGDLDAHATDPARFLGEMNRKLAAILHQIDEPLYATAFYLVADIARGELRYAKAGHPAPLLVRPSAGSVEPLPVPPHAGAALGLLEDTVYLSAECSLEAGDRVLLFTDGLFEVTDASGEEYGPERLPAAIDSRARLPLTGLLDGLLADVRAFSGDVEFDDDVCLLGMEVARMVRRC